MKKIAQVFHPKQNSVMLKISNKAFCLFLVLWLFCPIVKANDIMIHGMPLALDAHNIETVKSAKSIKTLVDREVALSTEIRADGRMRQILFVGEDIIAVIKTTGKDGSYQNSINFVKSEYAFQVYADGENTLMVLRNANTSEIIRVLKTCSKIKGVKVLR